MNKKTDEERNFGIETLKVSPQLGRIEVIEYFTTSYHSRSGGGD